MKIFNRICALYFSATGSTEKITNELLKDLSEKLNLEVVNYNFTLPEKRKTMPVFDEKDLVIVSTPTYAGRVPNLLLPYLQKINAKNSTGIGIVTYGNRNFDDSLIELTDLMKIGGINVIAAAAFIGEHSFSDALAKNRPDYEDMKIVNDFAKNIENKLKNNELDDFNDLKIEGKSPYRPYFAPQDRNGNKFNFVKIKPITDMDLCIDCKICVNSCPLGSIDYDDVSKVPGKCMKCCACIKKCPTKAKKFVDEGFNFHKSELEYMYAERKKPEIFL